MNTMSERRLSGISGKLSVQEMVLAHLREAHGHRTMDAHTKAMFDYHGPTLCDRIAAAVESEMKGEDRAAVRRVVRQRCHEALFLAYLAQECEFDLERGRRADG
jgi:hypothetical protein